MDAADATTQIANRMENAGWELSPQLQEALFEEMENYGEVAAFLRAFAEAGEQMRDTVGHFADDFGFNGVDEDDETVEANAQ